MSARKGEIVVGVLGQWASGKSTAANALVNYLGGESGAVFLTDFICFAGQAVSHILELEETEVSVAVEDDGQRRLQGEHAAVWLRPGEELETVDLSALHFQVNDDVIPEWLNNARVELGCQIHERSAEGKPIVVEAGYGKYPAGHAISDLFIAFERAGLEPDRVKWIIVEADFDKRSERNAKRQIGPPVDVFERYAADGGGMDPEHQTRLEEQGAIITRVSNNHDDVERFRADIIAAFEAMLGDVTPSG